MPESSQRSIKSFFQPPKRPRHIQSDSESDNEENRPRPSKSMRSGLEQQDEESDSDDQESLFNYIKKSLQVPMIKIQVLFQQIVQIQYKEQKGLMVESFLGRVNIKSYSLG